jgi:hypothetical protein
MRSRRSFRRGRFALSRTLRDTPADTCGARLRRSRGSHRTPAAVLLCNAPRRWSDPRGYGRPAGRVLRSGGSRRGRDAEAAEHDRALTPRRDAGETSGAAAHRTGYHACIRMRRQSRQPLAAPESLDAILSRAGESRFARVRPPVPAAVWRDAVGARIAERARPVWLERGTLVLRVPSSVWAHELSLLAHVVCARLGERGFDVRTLRFRVGPVPPLERPPERRVARSVPTERNIPTELMPALRHVDDDRLRDAITRAAATNLAWQSVARAAPLEGVSEARRAARGPRCAEEETSPPDRQSPGPRANGPRRPADARGRSR